jgi:AraC family transcriptional regulator, positive regulator of tynA and feaB
MAGKMTSALQHWSTAQAPEGKALEYWVEIICETIFKVHIDNADLNHQTATLTQNKLGPLTMHRLVYPRQVLRRTKQDVGQVQESSFDLIYVRSGDLSFTHYGKSIDVDAGSCFLVDSAEVTESRTSGGESVILPMPFAWLGRWMPNPRHSVIKPINATSPWGAVLIAALDAAANGDEADHGAAHLVAENIGVSLALAAGNQDPGPTHYSRKLFLRLCESMRDRAFDCGLTPSSVAAEHNISARYLQMTFAAAGTTFSDELWNFRLERAAQLLRDRRFDMLTVGDIGWRSGFGDPSHFARRFKRKYSCSPGAYRSLQPGNA